MGSSDDIPSWVTNGKPAIPKPAPLRKGNQDRLEELYSENIVAKVLRAAFDQLVANYPPTQYPETVPQSGPNKGRYMSRETDFWTCGYFPGSIYSLLERAIMYPHALTADRGEFSLPVLRRSLEEVGNLWSEPIHNQALRTDTHDVGLEIMPHMRPRWELLHDFRALDTIVTAAESLYQRFNHRLGAIRSWDAFDFHKNVKINNMEDDFLVIIDSMCNMDLLFYASAQSGNTTLADVAIAHSRTLLKSHLRVESASRPGFSGVLYSTRHLVNFSPVTCTVKEQLTAQGYSDTSTWTRGQAWGILGYAQAYHWSGCPEFLDAACGLAEYFLLRLENVLDSVELALPGADGRRVGRYVPLWDFDAPINDSQAAPRDTSAAVIAANGILILSQELSRLGRHEDSARYLDTACMIVQDTLEFALAQEKAQLAITPAGIVQVDDVEPGQRFDAILKHATVCFNAQSVETSRGSDTGLVYADYYLIEFGTRLLRMGLF